MMIKNSVEIKIQIADDSAREKLIASLSMFEFDGFEERDKELLAYYTEGKIDEQALDVMLEIHNLNYSKKTIPPENWNAVWENSFSPVIVNNCCVIRANFHAPVAQVKHDIIITPKMSFGTGHHATTYLMVQEMANIDFQGKAVVDFGTGTGVLAILAEKLGARVILAMDNDDWSIENARENVVLNNCRAVSIKKTGFFDNTEKFDIILANINRNVILENLDSLVQGLNSNGKMLVSGLLKEDEEQVVLSCESNNLIHHSTVEKGGWICMLFTY